MAEMKFIGVFNEEGKMVDRKIGFHSRDVLYYAATNNFEIVAVTLVKDGVSFTIFVKTTPREFYKEKVKAEDADKFLSNLN